MDLLRHAGRFPSEQQDIVRFETKPGVWRGRFGGQKNDAAMVIGGLKGLPAWRTLQRKVGEVIHASAAEAGICEGKARRFNDGEFQAEAGAKPADGGGVRGDVGLIQGDFERHFAGFS